MKRIIPALVFASSVIAVCGFYVTSVAAGPSDPPPDGRHGDTLLNRIHAGDAVAPLRTGVQSGNGINYHGGPVITNGTHVYYIWYGNWSGNSATSILPALARNIGGSPYFNINTTYYQILNGTTTPVKNAVSLSGQTTTSPASPYKYGTNLSDAKVQSIVSDALGSAALPVDVSGVYFVLTSADVNETSGFCTQYCGWHTYFTYKGVNIKYAFIGNAARCPRACEAQTTSPNDNPGADGMASIIAHELEESTDDPLLNAWYDNQGNEDADKCAWTFGTTYPAAYGSRANMQLGGLNFLIQQNWVNANGGYCALSY